MNQPPICTPVFDPIKGLMLNCPSSSSHNVCPPPKSIHEISSSAVNPYGTAAKEMECLRLALEVGFVGMIHVSNASTDCIERFESTHKAARWVDRDLET